MSEKWGTAGYVPGLKVKVSSAELAQHMRDRAEYHRKRAEEKKRLLPQVMAAAEQIKAQQPAAVVAQFSKSGHSNYRFDGDDAVDSLKGDIETHHNKSVAFDWLAGHLFESDYCLERSDLVSLEILKN